MKLQILLILAMLPMLVIPVYGEIITVIHVTTDKTEYYVEETMLITIDVPESSVGDIMQVIILAPNGDYVGSLSQHTITETEFTLTYMIHNNSPDYLGYYTIRAITGIFDAETIFKLVDKTLTDPVIHISVTTDKPLYLIDESILITGEISNNYLGELVDITITTPTGDEISNQYMIDSDNKFNTTFLLNSENDMGNAGMYTVKADYQGHYIDTSFELYEEVPTYYSEFTDESKQIEFKEITITWFNGTITNDEYVDVIKELVENRDLVLYTKFNQNELTGSILDFFDVVKRNTAFWLSGIIFDGYYINSLESFANYGILEIEDPSMILLSTDKSVYFANDEIFLNVDMLGYRIQEDEPIEIGIIRDYDGYNPSSYYFLDYLPITLDLTEELPLSKNANYTLYTKYHNLENFTPISFEIIPYYIEFQTDKSQYYFNDDIVINGIMTNIDWSQDTSITYEVYSSVKVIESGYGGILNEDGTFNFTINISDNEIESSLFGVVYLDITIQGFTVSGGFTYYHEPDMENETLYNMITDNNSTLSTQNEILLGHDSMLITHDYMMYNYNQTITSLTDTIFSLNNTITQQQLAFGYLTTFNFTLGETYPVIFDSTARSKINSEFDRIEDAIILHDENIIDLQIKLDNAIEHSQDDKIAKYEASIGSEIAEREFYNNLLNGAYLFIDVYPQD